MIKKSIVILFLYRLWESKYNGLLIINNNTIKTCFFINKCEYYFKEVYFLKINYLSYIFNKQTQTNFTPLISCYVSKPIQI